jgi:hypothetical protein
VRVAAFRYLKRPFAANQTIEPTQVAGFNQFFDDVDGTDAWRFGVALDHRFSERIFAGLEASYRALEVPIRNSTDGALTGFEDQSEQLYRGYLSVLLSRQLSFSAGLVFDDQQRDIPDDLNDTLPHRVTTLFAPLTLTWHHPSSRASPRRWWISA